jgi:hypothetical protein
MAPYAQTRLPWQDRWTRPNLDQLLQPLNHQQRRYFQQLIDQLDGYENVERELIWYGDSWKWTISYVFKTTNTNGRTTRRGSDPGEGQILCYLVPKTDQPLVCVPMADEQIQKLPMRRLGKFIRDGIKSAKCAVATHWATWTPTARTETELLGDLLKRKFKMLGASAEVENASKN